jgi:hypothetical protein
MPNPTSQTQALARTRTVARGGKVRIGGESELGDNLAVEQVILDDALQDLWGARAVPDSFGIDESDRAVEADPQTIGFGAIDQGHGAGEAQFFEPSFQVLPGFKAGGFRSAFRFGLVGAQEDMAAVFLQAEGVHRCDQFTGHSWD